MSTTIEKGSLVLVTGVSGYIASHTALQFLEAGYKVRGTVRSIDKADWLYELLDTKYGKGRFEAVVVPDMMADNAFDEAIKGVRGVCHMASVMTFSDKPDEVIPTVVNGATNAITAASKESSVKAFVYCSSSVAALMPQPDKIIKVTKETWDDEVVQSAKTNPNSWNVYGASKTEAERAIWKVAKEKNVPFQVACVLPNANIVTMTTPKLTSVVLNYYYAGCACDVHPFPVAQRLTQEWSGPIIKPNGEESSSTSSWVLRLFHGDADSFDSFPPQWHVDVRDTARLHVIALTDPTCNGERIFAFAQPFNRTDVLKVFRKLFPGKNFPEDKPVGQDLSQIPNQDAEALLKKHYGKGFTSLEDSLDVLTANYI